MSGLIDILKLVITIFYSGALLYIFLFSMGQLHLTWIYRKEKNKKKTLVAEDELMLLPKVTIQLPIYNEKYVVERLLDAVSKIDYPKDKLEIQILDDSTDETTAIINAKLSTIDTSKLDIKLIHRQDRVGFKAGALQHALPLAKGEYIAIFDADFIPEPSFLLNTIARFEDAGVGAVQTRWGHINRDYSMLTQLQAFSLDAHFSIEQTARNTVGSFINFNGTCGVWRKTCIIDAGGWSADTLTEDLDLSYRAQLKGWRFSYLENVATPGELPVIMQAIKSQQYRWNKGAAEVAKKIFKDVLFSKTPFRLKVHAFFHLFNSSVFLASLVAGILSIPMLFIKMDHPALGWVFRILFIAGLSAITIFFWTATRRFVQENKERSFVKLFLGFLVVFMGLSLHNGIAVIEGIIGIRTPFIRTPKFAIAGKKGSWKGNVYIKRGIAPLTFVEGLLCLYFIFGMVAGIYLGDITLLLFHAMLALGYGLVFYQTIRPADHA